MEKPFWKHRNGRVAGRTRHGGSARQVTFPQWYGGARREGRRSRWDPKGLTKILRTVRAPTR